MNYEEYFKRQIQLWGSKTQENLSQKNIAIIGSGGLGCSIALSLGSLGLKNVHLVDFDTIELSNIHRQIAFCMEDQGKYKCEVLAEILQKRIGSLSLIHSHTCDFKAFKDKNISLDLIVDASDNLFVREEISNFSSANNTPWLYTSVEEFSGQICLFERAKFSDLFKIQKRQAKGQIAPFVMQIASFSSTLAARYLASLPMQKDELHYIFYDKFGEFNHKKFKLALR